MLLEPHRAGEQHRLLREAAASGTRVLGTINDDVYRVLALPGVASVLTVDSSIACEAAYFGKRVYALAPLADPGRVARRLAGRCVRVAQRDAAHAGCLAHGAAAVCGRLALRRRLSAGQAEPGPHRP